jgi:hypothetical protein
MVICNYFFQKVNWVFNFGHLFLSIFKNPMDFYKNLKIKYNILEQLKEGPHICGTNERRDKGWIKNDHRSQILYIKLLYS